MITPRNYLATIEPDKKDLVKHIRSLIKTALPRAKESMKNGMLYYTHGRDICALAAQKQYVSLYVFDVSLLQKYQGELQHLSTGKSCLRFKKMQQVPDDLLEVILSEFA